MLTVRYGCPETFSVLKSVPPLMVESTFAISVDLSLQYVKIFAKELEN